MAEGYPRGERGIRSIPAQPAAPIVESMSTAALEREVPMSSDFDIDELLREIARYLAAIEAFRSEGHEPRWLVEEPWLSA
jgi:hypothetical protein